MAETQLKKWGGGLGAESYTASHYNIRVCVNGLMLKLIAKNVKLRHSAYGLDLTKKWGQCPPCVKVGGDRPPPSTSVTGITLGL